MSKPFASTGDTTEQRSTLEELAPGVYAFTAQGDPNVGAVVGPESVLCVDARATPTAAGEWLDALRQVTDKPVEWLVLTHYHAVRVLGASSFDARHIVAHSGTHAWIQERGAQDWESEYRRFPRLFRDAGSIPGLTYADVSFADTLTLALGDRDVQVASGGAADASQPTKRRDGGKVDADLGLGSHHPLDRVSPRRLRLQTTTLGLSLGASAATPPREVRGHDRCAVSRQSPKGVISSENPHSRHT